ncbi:MAG: PIN domain-containing protein [Verrucomicrobiota bacterium]|nr:PIN domain-containing protein [Verrucomicrobiota bacterium]
MGAPTAHGMNPVFVDASFWIAFRSKADANHQRSIQIATTVARQRRRLVTTWLIFAEIHAYFSRSKGLREQIIRDFAPGGVTQIEAVHPADCEAAIELLKQSGDKAYSFCDAASFIMMRRLNLTQVMAFDQHFSQIGEFEVL